MLNLGLNSSTPELMRDKNAHQESECGTSDDQSDNNSDFYNSQTGDKSYKTDIQWMCEGQNPVRF